MSSVDFDYVEKNGCTIYRSCFSQYNKARSSDNIPTEEMYKIIEKTEAVFELLVEQGTKYGFNVDAILEMPDSSGQTCLHFAAVLSEKICNYIIERPIKVNTITMFMSTSFDPDLAIQYMQKGINPYIIDRRGFSPVDAYPSSFENEEARVLLSQFSRSVHFSIEDIDCGATCPADCPSKFRKFFYKNGALVEMTDENRIGSGGFGMVFKQLFHGITMAMKCVWTGEIKNSGSIPDIVSDLNENISEIRTQTSTVGPGILVPEAFIRQQDQEKDENGKWIANNHNIFIYPLYDNNLYELHEIHYDDFTDEVLRNILSQCLTRKCSNR